MSHWLDTVMKLLRADTSDLRELANIANADANVFYLGVDTEKLDLSQQDVRGLRFTDFVSCRLAEIRNLGRREERIALILDSIVYDRSIGIKILDGIEDDRSDDVLQIVQLLKEQLSVGIVSPISRKKYIRYAYRAKDEKKIHSTIENIVLISSVFIWFSKTISYTRHHLFYFMVKHLSKYPEIKRYLQDKYMKGRTDYTNTSRWGPRYSYKEEIERYLGCSRPSNP